MGKYEYVLKVNEKLILKSTSVGRGIMPSQNGELILTNKSLVFLQLGMFGTLKQEYKYPVESINQAVENKLRNGVKIIEVYFNNGQIEKFNIATSDERILKLWTLALNERSSEKSDCYDYEYYQSLLDDLDDSIYEQKYEQMINTQNNTDRNSFNAYGVDSKFIGDVAKTMLKPGNMTMNGFVKGVTKASRKQATRNTSESLLDGLGISEWKQNIKDEFIDEFVNDIRDDLGLSPIETRSVREERKKEAIKKMKNQSFNERVIKSRQDRETPLHSETNSITDEIRRYKELLDEGILTEDEFNAKKKQLLGL